MARGKQIGSQGWRIADRGELRSGFSLIELLVVLGILSILMAILVPALDKVRRQARSVVSISNQRQIVAAANCFADEHGGRYPPSVATIGFGDHWNWQEPTVLTGYLKRTPAIHRSVSAYLYSYIENADVLFCPNAPVRYKYLQQAWEAGDNWDNPETEPAPDAMIGAYCLYWNYTGYRGTAERLLRGPTGPARGYRESQVLVTDYLGYDHWRSPKAFGSCEKLSDAVVTEGTVISSAYWSRAGAPTGDELAGLNVKLHAGYVDGHIESYLPAETAPMRVILRPETGTPYPSGVGPGVFYLPRVGLR